MPANQAHLAEKTWQKFQEDLILLSSNSKMMIALKSGHQIPYDQPEIVVEAVHQMIKALSAQ
jgi:carboxypeptidase C (cathepsin A)